LFIEWNKQGSEIFLKRFFPSLLFNGIQFFLLLPLFFFAVFLTFIFARFIVLKYLKYSLNNNDLSNFIHTFNRHHNSKEVKINQKRQLFYYPLLLALELLFFAFFSLPRKLWNLFFSYYCQWVWKQDC
jgi:hypothetical protein